MIEAYSNNIDVAAGSSIPLNNVSLQAGSTVTLVGASTVRLNCPGIYCISMDGYAEPSEAGDVTIQLVKDGINLTQAVSTFTGATGDSNTFHFDAKVKIPCQCAVPSEIQFLNSGVGVTGLHINVSVTKIK